MNKLILAVFAVLLSACTSKPALEVENRFKVDFGNIVEAGEFYEIRPNKLEVFVKEGVPTLKFGVRVENLARLDYELAFYIEKYNSTTLSFEEFTKGGYWVIKPPTNPDYEAFLWEDEKRYSLGKYRFVVVVEGTTVRVIEFSVSEDES
ncbi:hypothetical protein [Shewanella sp. 10N.286.52.A9]|uniref:hypothetical protein n=1 Tax=Shewanella sp. 10N.286.52.A9 TaxID=3229711 RepID=UPI00355138FF